MTAVSPPAVRAALATRPGAPFDIDTVELDGPRDDELLVRVVASGVCHTDVAAVGRLTPERAPMVFGHETAGVVEAIGRRVAIVRPGDHVVLSYRSCRQCRECLAGFPGYCAHFRALNFAGTRPDGSTTMRRGGEPVYGSYFGQSGFASHVLAYEDNTVIVDDALDLAVLAPFGCGAQTGAGTVLEVLRPGPAESFVVFGAGSVGIAALLAARAAGLESVIAVDPDPSRRRVAGELGASAVLDPASDDVVAAIGELTGGGASTALDTSGNPEAVATAIRSLRPRGRLALVNGAVAIEEPSITTGGRSIIGVIEGNADPMTFVPRLIEMWRAGSFPYDRIERRYRLEEINTAVADAHNGTTVKAVLVP